MEAAPRHREAPRTCVIGAGASGLPVIKALAERGLPVTCFERTPNIGGLWCIDNKPHGASAAYESLHINTDTRMTGYRDFPMPGDLPAYPGHRQIHRYFERYVEHFGLRRHIRFGSEVRHCRRLGGGGWEVTLADGRCERFGALVVANGHHWDPRGPDPAPPGRFDGLQFHSHAYRSPDEPHELRGKRVVVVGLGNSAVDIATELGSRALAAKVWLVARSGAWILPKWVGGTPITRFPDLQRRLPWLSWRVNSFILRWVMRLHSGLPTDYGLPRPDHAPLQSHPTVSQDLLSRIGHGDVLVKPAIRELRGAAVAFEDGTEEQADAIIWCTGYRVSLPFFDEDFLDVSGNDLPLWNRTLRPGVPDLYFVGLYQPLGAIMQLAELQGRIIGEHLLGRIGFPDEVTMRREMAAERHALERRYRRSPRHTMQVDFWPFMHRLQRMLDDGRRLAPPA